MFKVLNVEWNVNCYYNIGMWCEEQPGWLLNELQDILYISFNGVFFIVF